MQSHFNIGKAKPILRKPQSYIAEGGKQKYSANTNHTRAHTLKLELSELGILKPDKYDPIIVLSYPAKYCLATHVPMRCMTRLMSTALGASLLLQCDPKQG